MFTEQEMQMLQNALEMAIQSNHRAMSSKLVKPQFKALHQDEITKHTALKVKLLQLNEADDKRNKRM